MDPLISHRASLINYMPCEIHEDEQLTALCFNSRCTDYLKLLCIHCQDNHPTHESNKFIKSFKKSFTEIKQQFDLEKNQIEQRQNLSFDQQLLYNQIIEISEEYAILSDQLQQISLDIKQTAEKIFFQAMTDKLFVENSLDVIFKNGVEVEQLQQSIDDLKKFIRVDVKNNYNILFQIENTTQNDSDRTFIAKSYILKMQTNFKKIRDSLDALQFQAQSPDEEQIIQQKYQFSTELKHPDYAVDVDKNLLYKKNSINSNSIALLACKINQNQRYIWKFWIKKKSTDNMQNNQIKMIQHLKQPQNQTVIFLMLNRGIFRFYIENKTFYIQEQSCNKDQVGHFYLIIVHMFIGICLRSVVQQKKFVYNWEIGGGIYLINSSGQSYSNSEQLEHTKINILGRFYTGDIITMEFNPDLKKLSFVKNDNYHKKTTLTMPLPIQDDLYPCIKICDKNDEIQIID